MPDARSTLKIACPGCRQKLDVTDLDPFTRISCPRCRGDVIAPKPFGTLLLEEPLGSRRGIASFRALDMTLDREVTVRILEENSAGLADGFLDLARKAAAVNHPGIVPIFSCGTESGRPYFVSQFMAGGFLATRLTDWTVNDESFRRGVEWVRRIASGVQVAAAQGVVHGAVSPQSVHFDGDGNAKLGDFGLEVLTARLLAAPAAYGADVAAYISPEVLRGDAGTTASDVFGLGAVLYQVLTGRGPRDAAGLGLEAGNPVQDLPSLAPPRAVNAQVPQDLSDLCLRMLAVDPRARPDDLAELVQCLATAAKARAVPAQRATDKRLRNPPLPLPKAVPAQRSSLAPRQKRPRALWVDGLIASGLVVLAALGTAVYVRTHGWPAWLLPPGTSLPAGNGDDTTVASRPAASASEPALGGAVAPAAGQGAPALPNPAGDAAERTVLPPAPETGARSADSGSASLAAHAGRPRPEGLDFLGAKVALGRYLKGLSPVELALERERLALIGDTRDYLVRLMKYVTFKEGKDIDIRLRSGATLRGAIAYGNDAQVAVRRPGDNSLRMIVWSDLAFEQIVDILDFYIKLRADQGQVAGGEQNRALRQEVGEDCLRAAVLCAWYDRQELAQRYARKAAEADPRLAEKVSRLVPPPPH